MACCILLSSSICNNGFFFRFFFGRLSRGQPITTSSGKWLQLLLTISDVVDLSRFRFDLTYRVLPAAAVSVASSNSSSVSSYYGDPVPGTLCSRNLHSCDQRTCVIQSPNFPGLYPRFVSLFFFSLVYVSKKKETVSKVCDAIYPLSGCHVCTRENRTFLYILLASVAR